MARYAATPEKTAAKKGTADHSTEPKLFPGTGSPRKYQAIGSEARNPPALNQTAACKWRDMRPNKY